MIAFRPKSRLLAGGFTALIIASALACTRYAVHRLSGERVERAPTTYAPVAGLGAPDLRIEARGRDTHRILLDAEALGHLRESAQRGTEAYRNVVTRADEAMAQAIPSGYQGFDWADAVADLALTWHATADDHYADGAVRYLRALLDDRFTVGDQQGGKDVVTHDSGYGIRTLAVGDIGEAYAPS